MFSLAGRDRCYEAETSRWPDPRLRHHWHISNSDEISKRMLAAQFEYSKWDDCLDRFKHVLPLAWRVDRSTSRERVRCGFAGERCRRASVCQRILSTDSKVTARHVDDSAAHMLCHESHRRLATAHRWSCFRIALLSFSGDITFASRSLDSAVRAVVIDTDHRSKPTYH